MYTRLTTLLVSLVVLFAIPLSASPPSAAAEAPGNPRIISIAADGTWSDADSGGPDGGGPIIVPWGAGAFVFASSATNLVPGDTNGAWDVFFADPLDSYPSIERVSVAGDGSQASGSSTHPAIGGNIIAFVSDAADLTPDDTNGLPDIFVRDLGWRTTERISVRGIAPDGHTVDTYGESPSLSADGRYVAFGAGIVWRAPDTLHSYPGVYVHDLQTAATELVSVASDGTPANAASYPGAISADGRFVAFTSTASNLTPDDTDTDWDYFIHDRFTGATERIAGPWAKHPANEPHGTVQISGTGRIVAIWFPPVTHPGDEIPGRLYLYDRQTGAFQPIDSVVDAATGVTGNNPAEPALSPDGLFLAFTATVSSSPDLTAIFLLDRQAQTARLVTVGKDNQPAFGVQPAFIQSMLAFTGHGSDYVEGYAPATEHLDIISVDLWPPASPDTHPPIHNAAFWRTWMRTDSLIPDVERTWMWGPAPFTSAMYEPYTDSPGGSRLVQYFDKARMERTYPEIGLDSSWAVTNGLLVVEMMTGRMQIGDDAFEQREPAQINIAGDPDDPDGPTYATFGGLRGQPAAPDGAITQRVNRTGNLVSDPALASWNALPGPLVQETGHRVASVFWDFLNSKGEIRQTDGDTTTGRLFDPWFYASGLPVTEAYWTTVLVGGTPHDVLVQAFERRVLTWTPQNLAEWQVEAGNVGRHYYAWRYFESRLPVGEIAYLGHDQGGEGNLDVYVVNADGSDDRNLTQGVTNTPYVCGAPSGPQWAPDGSRLFFAYHAGASDGYYLWVINPDGTGLRQVSDHLIWCEFELSPDGTRIVVSPFPGRQVATMNIDGTGLQVLADGWNPRWSPDGAQIAFQFRDGDYVQIYAMSADGSGVTRITSGIGDKSLPAWTPDGQWITFSDQDSRFYGVRPDGSGLHQFWDLFNNQVYSLVWSPDGSKVVLMGINGIYVMNADGSGLTRVAIGYNATWSPDGRHLAYSADSGEIRVVDIAHPEAEHPAIARGMSPQWSPVP